MLLSPWVKPQTSIPFKRRDTLLWLISRKSSLSRLEQLKAIEATIQESLETDKMDYERDVFFIGRFYGIQKYQMG